MNPGITLEYRRRFWTVCSEGKPIATFPDLAAAIEAVPEATVIRLDKPTVEQLT